MSVARDVAAALDVPLHDAGGAATTLRAACGDGPAVVVFVRHFG